MDLRTAGVRGYVPMGVAAALLGVKPDTIRWRIRCSDAPVIRVGRSLLVSLRDLRRTYQESPRVLTGE